MADAPTLLIRVANSAEVAELTRTVHPSPPGDCLAQQLCTKGVAEPARLRHGSGRRRQLVHTLVTAVSASDRDL
jgi:hypothetical protein